MGLVTGTLPSRGLAYPKADESTPFLTREEIMRLPEAKREGCWDALFLTLPEIEEFLAFVRDHAAHAWIYPMAFTAARRSELIRMRVADVDFASGTLLVREKKRSKGRRTMRRVPLSAELAAVLKKWLAAHSGGPDLFCHAGVVGRSRKRSRTTGHQSGPGRARTKSGRAATVRERGDRPVSASLTPSEAHDHFKRTLAGSPWQVLRGWHALRHSFISACVSRGTDQRLIDEWVGHATEEMRRRYRHLYPSVQREAIASVFGKR